MADYLSLARLLQSGFWRARDGTFGECQTKTPPERAIWATRAGFREPSSAISSETRFLMKGSAQETHGCARGSSRNVRHEKPIAHAFLEAASVSGCPLRARNRDLRLHVNLVQMAGGALPCSRE
jgi:hypothetical protein